MIPAGQSIADDLDANNQIAITPKFARSHEIKIDESQRISVPSASDGLVARVGVIAGALIVASGLTLCVMSALPSPFVSAPVGGSSASLNPSAHNPDSQKGDRLPIHNAIIRGAAPPRSDATTVAVAPAPSEPKHSKHTVRQTTTSTKARDVEAQVKLTPVPETRPTTIEGWTLREVVNGMAVLEGPNGVWQAKRGDTVPGVGRIDSILKWGDRFMVATSSGLISTP